MESRKPRFFYGYIIVGITFLILLVVCGTYYTYGVFFKPILNEFGWSRAVTSGAYSLSFLLFGLLGIFMGRLNDRFGSRIVAVICGFFMGLGYLLMSLVSNVWQIYLFFGVVVAIGFSAAYVPLLSTLARWFVRKTSLMTGIAMSGIGVGAIIMPPIAGWLISKYGWRTSYIIMGIIVLVLIIVAAQFLRRPVQVGELLPGDNEAIAAEASLEAGGLHFREAVRTKQFWMLCGIFAPMALCIQAVIVHIVPYATDLGISAVTAASILSIIGGLSIVGRIGMGTVGDRAGNKRALTIGFIVMLFAFIWLLAVRGEWALFLFAVVFGFAYGGLIILESPIVAELFGLRAHGAILGAIHFGTSIGGATGPLAAGGIFDTTGNYHIAFVVLAGLSAVGLILTLALRPMRNKVGRDAVGRGA